MTNTKKPSKLDEIALRIAVCLKRLEVDKEWNVRPDGRKKFYMSGACRAGAKVAISYINYQPSSYLSREDAMRYMAALEGGFRGQHWMMENKEEAK
jgi:hypothetical protein